MRYTLGIIGCALLFVACLKESPELPVPSELVVKNLDLPSEPFSYSTNDFSESFNTVALGFFDNTPSSNPVTDAGATLGRVLFYDTDLSLDRSVACASCHHQANAFSDPIAQSIGINQAPTSRNSMALVNMQFFGRLFWDSRVNSIENQVLQPIEHPEELGMDLDQLVERLTGIPYYPVLFEEAFGSPEITEERISLSLAQFIRSLRSFSSRYDEGLESDFANFTSQELEGKDIFFDDAGDCNGCHFTTNFMVRSAVNNGLELPYVDAGLQEVTGNPEDEGKFRAPSLRNIEVTAPYMHDGRFETLEEVVDHYSEGIAPHPNLDDRLTTNGFTGGPPRQRNLSPPQKAALVAFLKTLTDESFLTHPAYSNPFD